MLVFVWFTGKLQINFGRLNKNLWHILYAKKPQPQQTQSISDRRRNAEDCDLIYKS